LLLRALSVVGLCAAALLSPAPAHADEDVTESASREYNRGNDLARAAHWAEALGAFEASYAFKAHALTLYNIGVCERVLGRATRARERFRLALARASADEKELPGSIREEVTGFLDEYARILPRLTVTLEPRDAGIAVDGRPLREHREGDRFVLEAGVEAPGIGKAPPAPTFDLEADPGTHVITITRQGYRDVVQTREFAPGQRGTLNLVLARLPSTIHVSSTIVGAQVRVNDVDVGLTPVDVTRPAGSYHLVVSRAGYVPFTNDITLGPGEESNIRATLAEERIPITKRWWFWTGAAGVVVIATVATYFITRPTPAPQPYDGGSTGWVVLP
jgi:hypothetical protein